MLNLPVDKLTLMVWMSCTCIAWALNVRTHAESDSDCSACCKASEASVNSGMSSRALLNASRRGLEFGSKNVMLWQTDLRSTGTKLPINCGILGSNTAAGDEAPE